MKKKQGSKACKGKAVKSARQAPSPAGKSKSAKRSNWFQYKLVKVGERLKGLIVRADTARNLTLPDAVALRSDGDVALTRFAEKGEIPIDVDNPLLDLPPNGADPRMIEEYLDHKRKIEHGHLPGDVIESLIRGLESLALIIYGDAPGQLLAVYAALRRKRPTAGERRKILEPAWSMCIRIGSKLMIWKNQCDVMNIDIQRTPIVAFLYSGGIEAWQRLRGPLANGPIPEVVAQADRPNTNDAAILEELDLKILKHLAEYPHCIKLVDLAIDVGDRDTVSARLHALHDLGLVLWPPKSRKGATITAKGAEILARTKPAQVPH